MVIASQDKTFDKAALRSSAKPLLLVQAGIHAGEIDGKDAGMMLLRDIAFGNKKDLLKNVNLLFIPILNVDGHERVSPYNRPNQRGPENMGWRANARNLNLNRDYTKLDSEEIRAVVQVMSDYNPSFYVDLHVTDGADYQYDITYGNVEYSPAIAQWLDADLSPGHRQRLKIIRAHTRSVNFCHERPRLHSGKNRLPLHAAILYELWRRAPHSFHSCGKSFAEAFQAACIGNVCFPGSVASSCGKRKCLR